MKRREFIAASAFCAALPAVPGIAQTTELTHARVGGPPDDWHKGIDVWFDGNWSGDWIEVNVEEGWGTRFVKDAKGRFIIDGNDIKRETMIGVFRIRYS